MKKRLLTCLSLLLIMTLFGACGEDLQEMEVPELLVAYDGVLVTSESGERAEFVVVLSSEPNRELVIGIESSDLTEAEVQPSELIFDEDNWFVPVTVTVKGLSDGIVDGDIEYNVELSEKTDALVWPHLEPVSLELLNIDIDVEAASFDLSTRTLVTREGGEAVDFSLALGAEPTSKVVVGMAVSDETEGRLTSSELVFNVENWDQAQVVKLIPLTDDIADGEQNYIISFVVSSADARYDGFQITPIDVKNIDIDIPDELAIRVVAANTTSGNRQSYDEGHGIRIFQALKPDIVMIQEFLMLKGSLRAMVDEAFGPEYYYTIGKGSLPNGVISRFPIIEQGAWPSNEISNRDWDWAVIDIPGPKDILVVSVHLSTKKHNSEMGPLKKKIESKLAEGDYYLFLGGDYNTSNRTNTQRVFASLLDVSAPFPVDQDGKDGTNARRVKPYDWVLACHELDKFEVPVVIGRRSYPHGHVFDSRVYRKHGELSDVEPVQGSDSGSSNMQHMAVVRDFVLKY